MPSYQYKAASADGRTVRDVAFAHSPEEVRARLAQEGLRVLEIQDAYESDPLSSDVPTSAAAETPATGNRIEVETPSDRRSLFATNIAGPLVGKVSLNALAFFFRQLGAMMEAGVPLVQSLETLSNQARDFRLRRVIREMSAAAQEGRMLSSVMQRHPEVFSPLMMALVRAGEEGGFLGQALKQTATYADEEVELRNMYRRETFIPKLQVAASIVIILAANAAVAFVNTTRGTNSPGLESPLTTASTWLWLGPLIVGLFLFFRVGLAQYGMKQVWDGFVLMVPFVGKTAHHFAMAKFGRAFGALYKAGVPVTKSIKIAADACGNEYLRGRIYPAAKELESGAGIAHTLQTTRAFSPVVMDMVATGETTGNMDHMLVKMAEFYEDEGKVRARQMVNVVSVLCLLIVGAYIAYIVITFYMQLYSGVSRELSE